MRSSLLSGWILSVSVSSCLDFDRFSEGRDASSGGAQAAAGAGSEAAGATGTGGAGDGGAGTTGGSSSGLGAGGAGGAATTTEPLHCRDIKERDPGAQDGDYLIDPDAEGAGAAFMARCDMSVGDGGWTRFNWLTGPYPTGSDPLAMSLDACDVDAAACPGRIPSSVNPTHLLVKDLSDGEHAAWQFDGSPIANAMIGALRDKIAVCSVGPAFDPFLDISTEDFCNSVGGCTNFKYIDSGCNDTSAWVLTLDDDSHYCRAAFKLGKATGNGNCGDVDWGFLDECDCMDEGGELYFR